MPTATVAPRRLTAASSYAGFAWREEPDGTRRILDVPLFCECERPDRSEVYDAAWVRAAFERLRQAAGEGHLPPLHWSGTGEVGRPSAHTTKRALVPAAAGMFEATRVGEIVVKGRSRTAVFADLLVTDPDAFTRIATKRLPYRSVEADHAAGELVSCALLDSEAPFIEGPMTILRDVGSATADFSRCAADESPVVAFARVGTRTDVLMEAAMPAPTASATPAAPAKRHLVLRSRDGVLLDRDSGEVVPFEKDESAGDAPAKKDGDGPPKPKGDGEGDTSKADRAVDLVAKLAATPVPLEDMPKVIEALEALLTKLKGAPAAAAPEAPKPSPDLAEPTPMAKPTDDLSPFHKEIADLRAQVATARAESKVAKDRTDAIEAARVREDAIARGLERLTPFTHAETRQTLGAIYDAPKTGGVDGLAAALAVMERTLPKDPGGARRDAFARDGAVGSGAYPAEVTALNLTTPEESEAALALFGKWRADRLGERGTTFDSFWSANRHLYATNRSLFVR